MQKPLRVAYLKLVDKFVHWMFRITSEVAITEVWFDCTTFLDLQLTTILFGCDAWVDTKNVYIMCREIIRIASTRRSGVVEVYYMLVWSFLCFNKEQSYNQMTTS